MYYPTPCYLSARMFKVSMHPKASSILYCRHGEVYHGTTNMIKNETPLGQNQ